MRCSTEGKANKDHEVYKAAAAGNRQEAGHATHPTAKLQLV